MRFAPLFAAAGALVLVGATATPVAHAQERGWHHWREHHWPGGRTVVVVPQPVPAPITVPVPAPAPIVVPAPAPQVVAVPVPVAAVPLPVQSVVLPAVQQVLPPAALQQTPLQLYPLGGNQYALIHPLLFCGADSVGTCQQMAQQLASVAPGFGTAVLDGPDGYGVYVTYQG